MTTEVFELPIDQLTGHTENPRTGLGDLDELVASIEQLGVLEPILCAPQDGHFVIVAGHRRVAACLKLGRTSVPAIVREDLADQFHDQRSIALVENVTRKDLSPVEKAQGFQQMVDAGLSQRDIAKRTGLNQSTISRALKPAERKPKVEKVTMTTYKRADGCLITDEFEFVTGLEWFEDDDEPTELVKETWVLKKSETLTVNETEPDEDEDEPPSVTERAVTITPEKDRYIVVCVSCGPCGRNTTLEYAEDRKKDHLWEVHGVSWNPDAHGGTPDPRPEEEVKAS